MMRKIRGAARAIANAPDACVMATALCCSAYIVLALYMAWIK